MEFNFRKNEDSSDLNARENSQSLASERLRKAIERNRRKQELKDRRQEETQEGTQEERQEAIKEEANQWVPPSRPSFKTSEEKNDERWTQRHQERNEFKSGPKHDSKSFLEEEESAFVRPNKMATKKFPEVMDFERATSYGQSRMRTDSIPSRTRGAAQATTSSRYRLWATKLAWAVVAIFILRLVFVKRGVVDYYTRLGVLGQRDHKHKEILAENRELRKEIYRIRTDSQIQKKIVRDHLGFIAEDEYLVLFAYEKGTRP